MMKAALFVFFCLVLCAARAADTVRLTLYDAVRIALRKNYDVQLMRQDSLLARNLGSGSITNFLPRVNVQGSVSSGSNNIDQVLADGRRLARDGATVSNMNANAVLSWTLFDGFRMFASADRLRALEAEGLARVQAGMLTVVADVITTYNGLVANQQFLATVDSALQLAEERFLVEQQRYNVGATSGVQLSQARIDLNSQRALRIQMAADVQNASSALLTLLGEQPQSLVLADTTNLALFVPDLSVLTDSASTLNPDVVALQHSLEAASAHIAEARSAFLPTLSVSAGYQYNRTKQGAGFILENQAVGWNLGAQLQWNIFNGFSDQLARERALVLAERSRIEGDALRNQLTGQLHRTYLRYTTAAELRAIEQQSYGEAMKNATIALERLRIGTIDGLEVRQAFLSLLTIGESIARRTYEQRLAATELLRLSGLLLR